MSPHLVVCFAIVCFFVLFLLYMETTSPLQLQNPLPSSSSLRIPLFLHIVNNGDESQVSQSIPEVQRIWDQAGIQFDPVRMDTIQLRPELVTELIERGHQVEFQENLEAYFNSFPEHALHVFFVSGMSPGIHGRAYFKNRLFSVISLSNFGHSLPRTIAHELGHLMLLHHPSTTEAKLQPDLLMIPGHAGVRLTPTEIEKSRQFFEIFS
jgi:hypothetical protein